MISHSLTKGSLKMEKDIRWKHRFSSFKKALNQLQKFIDKKDLSELEEQGLIKSFEYTYELAWNTIKDFLEFNGHSDIFGSRDAFRKAYKLGIIEDGSEWMSMLKSRNRTSHTYNEKTAKEIVEAVFSSYFPLFNQLKEQFTNIEYRYDSEAISE